jgi:hypothetical protein
MWEAQGSCVLVRALEAESAANINAMRPFALSYLAYQDDRRKTAGAGDCCSVMQVRNRRRRDVVDARRVMLLCEQISRFDSLWPRSAKQ